MKKLVSLLLTLTLLASLFAGCAGTTVVVGNCTCPPQDEAAPAPAETAAPAPAETTPLAEGQLRTGLAIVTTMADSTSASAEAAGAVKYDVTVAAVTVDENGVIQSCTFDSLGTSISFDATGAITTDLSVAPITKGEMKEDYGMKAAGSQYEWYEQAAAVAACAEGKTIEEFKAAAANPAENADLSTSASIYIGGYVAAIEKAVANAQVLGAQSGDELKMAVIASVGGSTSATAEAAGNAQLDVDVAVITMNGETITSCYIDSVQAKVGFDAAGALTTDVSAPAPTKNELGPDYNMVTWGQAKAEWNEQAASFAEYVTGKTAAEVASIAVSEDTKPTDADLAANVTIKIGGFQDLIAKAAG